MNKNIIRKTVSVLMIIVIIASSPVLPCNAGSDPLEKLTSEAFILMEGSTGKIIYEKNSRLELRPASITKIMTLLLIFEAIENGNLNLSDKITVSEHAASMGGSQVFLEAGEIQDAETMIKCICIASANDASVAMAEHIAGSEEAFVLKMNERAKQLGMDNTNFVNCYGLDTDNHYSCALDVALMSRELIINHPEITKYTTVWMDTFVHTTSRGETEFGLTNTNKLIKSYNGITGLKTGSTGLAKYCLSATARRNDMDLIAVIMAAPDTKTRFKEAAELLNYGYANCKLYRDELQQSELSDIKINNGLKEMLPIRCEKEFSYIFTNNENINAVERKIEIKQEVQAPVSEGDIVGAVTYYYDGQNIGGCNILAAETVEEAGFLDYFKSLMIQFF